MRLAVLSVCCATFLFAAAAAHAVAADGVVVRFDDLDLAVPARCENAIFAAQERGEAGLWSGTREAPRNHQ